MAVTTSILSSVTSSVVSSVLAGEQWWLDYDPNAAFVIDAIGDRAYVDGTAYNSLTAFIASSDATFTRIDSGGYISSNGTYTLFDGGVPRVGDVGILVEPDGNNYAASPDAAGAVVGIIGSGGAIPAGWSLIAALATTEVVAIGTEFGLPYVDMRFAGTPSVDPQVRFSTAAGAVANIGETWAASLYARRVAGSSANINTVEVRVVEADGGSFQDASNAEISIESTSRTEVVRTFSEVGTDGSQPRLRIRWDNSGPIDITLRISVPQLEESAAALSPLLAESRGADVFTIKPASDTYDITITFDDDSTQTLSSQVIGGSGWVVPTNLNRDYIKSIVGVTSLSGFGNGFGEGFG